MNTESYIRSTFLKLTSKTYPYGYEEDLVAEMINTGVFPKNLELDSEGNYFLKIGESRTIFASHFDTACKDQVDVTHVFENNFIKTDKKSILGADDKAGVTILLWLMKNNIPGLYYFFIGEEVGCIGSGLAAKNLQFKGDYDRIISFDRRGTSSIITHQSGTRTCSDEFGVELAKQLNQSGMTYRKDDTGVYTDSAEFTSVIPECTNISVGYYQEHTHSEHQDIVHLTKLAKACLGVKWEELPTKRDMTKVESKWDNYGSGSYSSGSYSSRSYSGWNHNGFSRGTGNTWNNSNFSKYDHGQYEDYPSRKKKTRRGNTKKRYSDSDFYEDDIHDVVSGKTYFDNGTNLIDLNNSSSIRVSNNYKYEALKEKFLSTSLSKEEIEIIKEQYLDWNNPDDRDCYEVLINSLVY
jgi:hypothetical protein